MFIVEKLGYILSQVMILNLQFISLVYGDILISNSMLQQVSELSQPSSPEVEDIIQQVAQNILHRFFEEDACSHLMEDSVVNNVMNDSHGDDDLCDSIDTSRDYLARLLFWYISLYLPN